MNGPGTAREALLAEALGDLAELLERAEALRQAMAESCQALREAQAQLADQLAGFEAQLTALTERAKVQAVKHIIARTEEAARRSVDVQTRAMSKAAQELFRAEIGPALQRFAAPPRQLAERENRPWERWLLHTATALLASLATLGLAAWLWVR